MKIFQYGLEGTYGFGFPEAVYLQKIKNLINGTNKRKGTV